LKNKVRGKFAYILSVLITLATFRKKTVSMEIDGKKSSSRLVLLAIGNGKYYGGGMMILPQAKLDDKYLHLCLVENANNFTLLALFPTIFKGSHTRFKKYVKVFKAKEVILKSFNNMYFNIDGEIHPGGKEVKFNLCKEKLSVIYE